MQTTITNIIGSIITNNIPGLALDQIFDLDGNAVASSNLFEGFAGVALVRKGVMTDLACPIVVRDSHLHVVSGSRPARGDLKAAMALVAESCKADNGHTRAIARHWRAL